MAEFRQKKKFGQHFLKDKNIVRKIVRIANLDKDSLVWEIGPGKGILTNEILNNTPNLTCFEIDKDLYELIETNFDVTLIKQDVLIADWQKLLDKKQNVKIVSNLPYMITTPFLFKIAEFKEHFSKVVIMIQKEVAQRITAEKDTKKYGILSLKLQFYFDIKYEFTVKPHLFFPPPKVDSAVISMIPKQPDFILEKPKLFWRIVTVAFQNRRKMLRRNFRIIIENEKIPLWESSSKVDMTKRAENLSIKDFYSLYLAYMEIVK